MQSLCGSTRYLRDPARLAALHRYHLLDATATEEGFNRLPQLACRLLDTPVSLISIVTEDRQIFKGGVGLPEPWATWGETPLSYSICQHVVTSGKSLLVADAREDPLLCRNRAVLELGVVAYLGMPIVTTEGHTLGAFCVIASTPRGWTAVEIEILRDLTRLATIEIERRGEVAARAEAVIRARDEFLSIASHELRNPVAVIKATSQLLKRTLDQGRIEPERLSRYATTLNQTSCRLATLVNDLFDASWLPNEQLLLRRERIDLAVLLRILVGQLPTAYHRVRVECSGEPCPIRADRDRIEQVLANLLNNAVKYSPNGGEIVISLTRASEDILIQVKDSGIGIPAEDLERIFEPFGRASNAARRKLPGMGLGLYICRKIVTAHGGTLWAESPGEDKGTTMFIRLPLEAWPAERTQTDA